MAKKKKFNLCAVGGTFDRLHKGHEALLSTAFHAARKVVVGVTSCAMVKREKKTLASVVQPFQERVSEVKKFLARKGWGNRAQIVALEDFAGPAKNDRRIDCIAATAETAKPARKVNRLRKEAGLLPLKIVLCPFVRAQDRRHISSTRIRLGSQNRRGKIYAREFARQTLLLTRAMVPQLKKPLGILVAEKPGSGNAARKIAAMLARAPPTLAIVVGDMALSALAKAGAKIDLGFSDLKTMRKKAFKNVRELGFKFDSLVMVRNPASRVSRSLANATRKAVFSGTKTLVRVLGEEDLAVLPAVLFAPLGTAVIYGQPNRGLVLVRVGEMEKEKVARLLARFSKK
ncbi:MAG: pantetheine-phosphate adenylyltransferase [Candidatus Micrarchaeia archaeon]